MHSWKGVSWVRTGRRWGGRCARLAADGALLFISREEEDANHLAREVLARSDNRQLSWISWKQGMHLRAMKVISHRQRMQRENMGAGGVNGTPGNDQLIKELNWLHPTPSKPYDLKQKERKKSLTCWERHIVLGSGLLSAEVLEKLIPYHFPKRKADIRQGQIVTWPDLKDQILTANNISYQRPITFPSKSLKQILTKGPILFPSESLKQI